MLHQECLLAASSHRSGIEPDVSLSKIYVRDFEELASALSDLLASDLLASDLLASDLLASDLLHSRHYSTCGIACAIRALT